MDATEARKLFLGMGCAEEAGVLVCGDASIRIEDGAVIVEHYSEADEIPSPEAVKAHGEPLTEEMLEELSLAYGDERAEEITKKGKEAVKEAYYRLLEERLKHKLETWPLHGGASRKFGAATVRRRAEVFRVPCGEGGRPHEHYYAGVLCRIPLEGIGAEELRAAYEWCIH